MDFLTKYYDELITLSPEEYATYRALITKDPVLEIGCGTGQLLLPLLAEGYDIEGIDASEMALDICHKKAAKRGLQPLLYHQKMEDLYLGKKYQMILLPANVFGLLQDPDVVSKALTAFSDHLSPDGSLILTLYCPTIEDIQMQGIERLYTAVNLDKTTTIAWFFRFEYDLFHLIRTGLYRFVKNDIEVKQQFMWRFYGIDEITMVLSHHGFSLIRYFKKHNLLWLIAKPAETSYCLFRGS